MFSNSTIERLPRYYRILRDLLQNGIFRVSSSDLSKKIGVSPSLVRNDLKEYPGSSIRGYGYNVKDLYKDISLRLGVGDGFRVIILGGNESVYSSLSELLGGRGLISEGHILSDAEIVVSDIALILDGYDMTESTVELLEKMKCRCIWNMSFEDISATIPVYNLPIGDIIMMMCAEIRNKNEV